MAGVYNAATYRAFATGIIFVFLLVITVTELRHHYSYSSPAAIEARAAEAVNSASENMLHISNEFLRTAEELGRKLSDGIENGATAEQLYDFFQSGEDLWGGALFADSVRLIWIGFTPSKPIHNAGVTNTTVLRTQNNVRFLEYSQMLAIDDSTTYTLVLRRKISQDNILSLGSETELDPSEAYTPKNSYPVRFAFTDSVTGPHLASAPLLLADSTRISTIYATVDDLPEYLEEISRKFQNQRHLFLLFFLATAFLLLGGGIVLCSTARGILFILLPAFFLYILAQRGVLLPEDLYQNTNLHVLHFMVHALFFTTPAVALYHYSSLYHSSTDQPLSLRSSAGVSVLLTLLSLSGMYWYLHLISELITGSSLWLLDLTLIPGFQVLLFYVASAIFFISLLVPTVLAYRLLFSIREPHRSYVLLGSFTGVLIGIIMLIPAGLSRSDGIALIFVLFCGIAGYVLTIWQPVFLQASRIRLVLLLAFLTVAFSYAQYAPSHRQQLDQRMLLAASEFSTDEEDEIRSISGTLLMELHLALSGSSEQAFNDFLFDRLVESLIQPEWLRYTISVQVIDEDGDQFTDYTTSLAPPQWSTRFRIEELAFPFEDEQIRRDRLRPVFRTQPINTINARYSSFIRGWIPLYADQTSEEIAGWILCSVYRELPQLNRPLRTVVQAGSRQEWQRPFVMTEYRDGISARTSISGLPLNVPAPAVLSPEIRQRTRKDSVFFRESVDEQLRELFVSKDNGSVIRVARRQVEVNQHLFSFLRHFMLLVIFGVIGLSGAFILGMKHVFGTLRMFKDRLIDRFIIASFLCLMALAVTSYVILDRLNTEDVRNELFERLETLVLNLENESVAGTLQADDLQELVTTLNADASLFTDGELQLTTTTQIFSQHVLPSSLSWPVFEQLSEQERSRLVEITDIDGQQMMIGYMPWYDQERKIAGIASVPTFVKAPKFYERLLSTTSYLLAFFTIIFGLLLTGVSLVTRQLTAPIEALQQGLKKITEGDLDTKLEVPGEDEIGMLTSAYNIMASRLRSLQDELAEKEREAAWKEMAQQVAHEIKNPLTPMKLSLQHLQQQLNATGSDLQSMRPRIGSITKNMIEQIDALSRIASDFSRFGRPQEQPAQPLDLKSLVASVAGMYQSEDSIAIRTDFRQQQVQISGVAEDIRRVLINLIKNAVEATGEQGVIDVSVDITDDMAVIRVTDNGKGITDKDLDQIFSPRFSTKSSGSGLGLAISKKIVDEHNGTLTVVSTSGKGTTFEMQIPLLKESL